MPDETGLIGVWVLLEKQEEPLEGFMQGSNII